MQNASHADFFFLATYFQIKNCKHVAIGFAYVPFVSCFGSFRPTAVCCLVSTPLLIWNCASTRLFLLSRTFCPCCRIAEPSHQLRSGDESKTSQIWHPANCWPRLTSPCDSAIRLCIAPFADTFYIKTADSSCVLCSQAELRQAGVHRLRRRYRRRCVVELSCRPDRNRTASSADRQPQTGCRSAGLRAACCAAYCGACSGPVASCPVHSS
jgi:hypothetical protein